MANESGLARLIPGRPTTIPARWLAALAGLALVIGVGWVSFPLIGSGVARLLLLDVALTTWMLGPGPGFLVLVLGGLTLPFLFVPPLFSFAIESAQEAANVATYGLVGLVLILLITRLQAARREVEANEQRREALLRVARSLAAHAEDRLTLLRALVEETSKLYPDTVVTVYRWDAAREVLVPVAACGFLQDFETTPLRLGEGVNGRAAAARATCVIDDYQHAIGATTPFGQSAVRSGIGVPLQYEGRLLGTLAVGTLSPGTRLAPVDAQVLELLASTAAAIFIGLERAQLEGVLLAARTAQHELNNQLAQVVGYADLLVLDPAVTEELAVLGREILAAAQEASGTVERLRRVTQVETIERGGPGPVLDLGRSTEKPRTKRTASAK
jgi:K+-sensing histidine kinase KdpD